MSFDDQLKHFGIDLPDGMACINWTEMIIANTKASQGDFERFMPAGSAFESATQNSAMLQKAG
jgi:hypothetical protein